MLITNEKITFMKHIFVKINSLALKFTDNERNNCSFILKNVLEEMKCQWSLTIEKVSQRKKRIFQRFKEKTSEKFGKFLWMREKSEKSERVKLIQERFSLSLVTSLITSLHFHLFSLTSTKPRDGLKVFDDFVALLYPRWTGRLIKIILITSRDSQKIQWARKNEMFEFADNFDVSSAREFQTVD